MLEIKELSLSFPLYSSPFFSSVLWMLLSGGTIFKAGGTKACGFDSRRLPSVSVLSSTFSVITAALSPNGLVFGSNGSVSVLFLPCIVLTIYSI